jgi:hypothetical protein
MHNFIKNKWISTKQSLITHISKEKKRKYTRSYMPFCTQIRVVILMMSVQKKIKKKQVFFLNSKICNI